MRASEPNDNMSDVRSPLTGRPVESSGSVSPLPPAAALRWALGPRWRAPAIILVIWAASRVPGIVGFVIAQRAQGLTADWTQLAARWDGAWYVLIAHDGYPTTLDLPGRPHYGPWGFFAFWPWTIRAVGLPLGGDTRMAALVATVIYGLCAMTAVYVAGMLIAGTRTAMAATLLFAFFPGSLSLTMPYTEGSFIFWSVVVLIVLAIGVRESSTGTIAVFDRARPIWVTTVAALAAFLASGTRSTGVALLAAVAVDAVVRLWRSRRMPWSDMAVFVAGVLGFVANVAYAAYRTGDPFIWRRAQAQWDQVLDLGSGLFVAFTRTIPAHGPDYRAWTVMLIGSAVTVIMVLLGLFSARRIPITWWTYSCVLLALFFLWSNVGPRPRMLLALVPVVVAAATTIVRWKWMGWALIAVTVGLMAAASVVYAFAVFYKPWHVTA